MSEQTPETLLTFPCKFPIKVFGKQQAENDERNFEQEVMTIVKKHFKHFEEGDATRRDSKGGKYLSLTVTVTAESKDQLDAVYKELTSHDLVVMAL